MFPNERRVTIANNVKIIKSTHFTKNTLHEQVFVLHELDKNKKMVSTRSLLVSVRCGPLVEREDNVAQTAVPHKQRNREDGAGYATGTPQTMGGQRFTDGCSSQKEPMFGVHHQPGSPAFLICLYDHRSYGLVAIDEMGV